MITKNKSIPRIITVVLINNGLIVRSQNFTFHQIIGNPISTIKRLSDWGVDELIILDISRKKNLYDIRRDDLNYSYNTKNVIKIIKLIANECFIPLTFGGGIKKIDQISEILRNGADKVSINTAALNDKNFIKKASKKFGSQCIVVSIDVKKNYDEWVVFSNNGTKKCEIKLKNYLKVVEDSGAGELFINSIDRDGVANGFDIELVDFVNNNSSLPKIFCGGAGSSKHFIEVLKKSNVSLAAANIFHFKELSYQNIKKDILKKKIDIRKPIFKSYYIKRNPVYSKNELINKIKSNFKKKPKTKISKFTRWCTKCVYPSISAAPLEFDSKGVCTGCQVNEKIKKISQKAWNLRLENLEKLLKSKKKDSKYDCVIAVSGGKDSYFQVHIIKEVLGLTPLLVTYDGNNWTKTGFENMRQMKDVFGCDHLIISPSVSILKKLNKICFYVMGDMNWHAHVGIMTQPMSVANKYNIPFVIYGEHGYLDLSGQFSINDFPEVTYRDRLEHFARGYEWNYFENALNLKSSDLNFWKYPSDEDIFKIDLRGIFLGNYVQWDANNHIELVKKKYNFKVSKTSFDRTYRTMSNLDDMHENGVHDYLKYIKFGYGRATDHASKDIRSGKITRAEAIKLVKKYDHIKPSDLKRWLNYVGMTEKSFDFIADSFRDKRVWKKIDNKWTKKEIE